MRIPSLLLAGVACLLLMGCAGGGVLGTGITLSGGSVTIESPSENVVLKPDLNLRVYRAIDQNTADFFLSDLDEDTLLDWLAGDNTTARGNLIHIHMFLHPKAGRTPIDYTASNVTITHTVIAGDVFGVYGGGGFLLPSGNSGDKSMGGNLRDATLRYLRGSDGFVDRMDTAEISGGISAKRNDELAQRISTLIAAAGR